MPKIGEPGTPHNPERAPRPPEAPEPLGLSGLVLQIQDYERRRIARELHDDAAQVLAGLSLNLNLLRLQAVHQEPRMLSILDECQQLTSQLSQQLRTMSYLLYPPLLDEFGLTEALGWHVQDLQARHRFQVELAVPPGFARLAPELELVIFRVVQQSLANVHRLSKSTSATVRLAAEGGAVSVEIQHYGGAVSPDKLTDVRLYGTGAGIAGLRERVREAQGELRIEPNELGVKISAVFPASETRASP